MKGPHQFRSNLFAACIVLLLAVGLLCAVESMNRCPQAVQPTTWVIRHEGRNVESNCNALSSWFFDHAAIGGTSWGGCNHVLNVDLSSQDGATPRSELLRLAAEAEKNLPGGCPITIEVETLEEAIVAEERYIQDCRETIERLRRIHGNEIAPDRWPLTPSPPHP